MHGYVPKRKKGAQDGQRTNENDESVANSFADLKFLSAVVKRQTKMISMCIAPVKVKTAARRRDDIDICHAGQLHSGFLYPRNTS